MSRFSKFDQFFSVQSTETPRLRNTQHAGGSSVERVTGANQLLSRQRRSYSIENTLKLIKQKEDMHTRVTDFLTNKKLGLLTEEQNKELKQLRSYNQGNRTKEETLVFLKQLKKEQDECVATTRGLQTQISKLEHAAKKLKEQLQQAQDEARFTEEVRQDVKQTAVQRQKEFEELKFSTNTALYQNQVYQQIIARSKEHNIWLKGRLGDLRQLAKQRQIKLDSLERVNLDDIRKSGQEGMLAEEFHDNLRQSSAQLLGSFNIAQQTIESKNQLLQQITSNQQLKEQAAREYELKFLSDKKLWRNLRVHRFYSIILNYKHFRLEEANAPLEHAFAVVKMRTAIKDPILFWNSYFQSSRTYEDLKERAKLLEEKQQQLEKTNRALTDEFVRLALQTASRDTTGSGSWQDERQAVPLSTYEHIDRATETLSKVTLWASRIQYKMRSFLRKRVEVVGTTTANELMIKMFLEVLQERLLTP